MYLLNCVSTIFVYLLKLLFNIFFIQLFDLPLRVAIFFAFFVHKENKLNSDSECRES